jgi:K+-sensing histidine kinase KdpD
MALQVIHPNPELGEKPARRVFKWRGYLIGLWLVVLATLLGYLMLTFFAPTNIIMIYLLCVT